MFDWDARKPARNIRKHGVSFEEAATIFADPDGLEWEDLDHGHTEDRSKRLGFSVKGRIIILVYSNRRMKDGRETIRIITARQASSKEYEAYKKRGN
jgi:uncharacterized DUF497 family protein